MFVQSYVKKRYNFSVETLTRQIYFDLKAEKKNEMEL